MLGCAGFVAQQTHDEICSGTGSGNMVIVAGRIRRGDFNPAHESAGIEAARSGSEVASDVMPAPPAGRKPMVMSIVRTAVAAGVMGSAAVFCTAVGGSPAAVPMSPTAISRISRPRRVVSEVAAAVAAGVAASAAAGAAAGVAASASGAVASAVAAAGLAAAASAVAAAGSAAVASEVVEAVRASASEAAARVSEGRRRPALRRAKRWPALRRAKRRPALRWAKGGPRFVGPRGGPRFVTRGGRRIAVAPATCDLATASLRHGHGHRWRWRGRWWHSYGYIAFARPYCTGFTYDGCYRRWILTPVGYRCAKFCPW